MYLIPDVESIRYTREMTYEDRYWYCLGVLSSIGSFTSIRGKPIIKVTLKTPSPLLDLLKEVFGGKIYKYRIWIKRDFGDMIKYIDRDFYGGVKVDKFRAWKKKHKL